jgi:PPM family protein phosphatase
VTISWEAAGLTDVGRVRRGNEDAFRLDLRRGVFIVADGMGGHAAGEIASALAADTALETLTGRSGGDDREDVRLLEEAFQRAFRRIVDCCDDDPATRGMGTTLTAALVSPGGSLSIGHIGDSRLYLASGGSLRQLTRDHTWVQREMDAGRLDPQGARNHPLSHILTQVLSAEEAPSPDITAGQVAAGDSLLLCSDGLHNLVDGATLLELITSEEPLPEIAAKMIDAANRKGGNDNITVILVRVH